MDCTDQAEIRILGPLLVRRSDGSVVQPAEWRTSKTAELLRLLALDVGCPVGVDTILDKLWPGVPVDRAKGSLRTAACQIRRTLRSDCVERRSGSLVLHAAWVDGQAYAGLVGEVERSRREHDHATTVSLVREAEALYGGDLEAQDPSVEWLHTVQQQWRRQRLQMLLDAAEAALALTWMRDARDFAALALELDPQSEQAARALMRAWAGLGELDEALATFEKVRKFLADEFGVDPSPQTRALHLQLLTTSVDADAEVGTIGQEIAVDAVVSAVIRLRSAPSARGVEAAGSGVIYLRGVPGSGRDSIAHAACRLLRLTTEQLSPERYGFPSHAGPPFHADVVVMTNQDTLGRHEQELLRSVADERGVVLMVPVRHLTGVADTARSVGDSGCEVVDVPPLSHRDLTALARAILQGEPTPDLVRTLHLESGGLSGRACRIARTWLADGRVAWTPEGLALQSGRDDSGAPPFASLAPSIARLPWAAIDVLTMLAVLDSDIASTDVDSVLNALHPDQKLDVGEILDVLVDGRFLTLSPQGYRIRNERYRDEVLAWMRPAARRRMHCHLADTVALDPASKVTHWIAGGEHTRACETGVLALRHACSTGDVEAANRLLDALHHLPARMQPDILDHPLGYYLREAAAEIVRLSHPEGPAPAA